MNTNKLVIKVSKPYSIKPSLPDYTDRIPKDGFKTLTMDEISKKIHQSRNYWISTCVNNKPHSFPIWGIWYENQFSFSTGPNAKKGKNLVKNNLCTITTENASQPVIIEGIAFREKISSNLSKIIEIYYKKYNWKFHVTNEMIYDDNGTGGPVFTIKPTTIYAWNEFPTTFSKWVFKD